MLQITLLLEIRPDLHRQFGEFCVWSIFRILVHGEDKSAILHKNQYWHITTSRLIYVIDVSWLLDVYELFLSQNLIYSIMSASPGWPLLGLMTFGCTRILPFTHINALQHNCYWTLRGRKCLILNAHMLRARAMQRAGAHRTITVTTK